MKKNCNMMLFTAVFILFSLTSAMADDPVTWPVFSYPPVFIIEQGKTPSGVGIDVINLIKSKLPEYEHKIKEVPISRVFRSLQDGYHYCAYGVLKTPEREAYMYYSLPCRITTPCFVVVRKEDVEKFGGGKKISLRELLENNNLKLLIKKDVIYNKEINSVIDGYAGQKHVYVLPSDELGKKEVQLLAAKRIDYTISVVSTAYEAKQMGLIDKISFLPFEDTYNHYDVGYIACPKNEWGRQMTDKINKILKEEIPKPQFFDLFKPLVTENMIPELRNQYEKLIMNSEPAK